MEDNKKVEKSIDEMLNTLNSINDDFINDYFEDEDNVIDFINDKVQQDSLINNISFEVENDDVTEIESEKYDKFIGEKKEFDQKYTSEEILDLIDSTTTSEEFFGEIEVKLND